MKLRSGIKLLREIEGHGPPIGNKDRYDAVLKFYRNQGEPLMMPTVPVEPIPFVTRVAGEDVIAWEEPSVVESHVVIERDRMLAREADVLPGIYYSILGMKAGGFRYVIIPPHLYAHSMYEIHGIDKESIVKLEVFLTAVRRIKSVWYCRRNFIIIKGGDVFVFVIAAEFVVRIFYLLSLRCALTIGVNESSIVR